MLEKKEILMVLKKYGYYSKNRAPFLYQEKEKVGLYFVWPHKHYGKLERVLYFDTIEELDDEVYKYWWFMNHKEKYDIQVVFDNYETPNPKVSYFYRGNVLKKEDLLHFENQEVELETNEKIKRRELFRTATILILILKEKLKKQNETYQKVNELSNTFQQLKKDFKNKLNSYKKGMQEESPNFEIGEDSDEETSRLLANLHNELMSLKNIEDIRKFIASLIHYLHNLDMSLAGIQNLYLLERYPYEIEDVKKKITILEEANAKKKLFQNKQEIYNEFHSIDNLSECKKMVDMKTFIAQKQEEIEENYQNLKTIDETVLGDYIVSFEKLNLMLPPMVENLYQEFNKEDLFINLKNMFDHLSTKEQSACYVASSFLRDCLIILMEKHADTEINNTEIISKLVLENQIYLFNDAYTTLDYYMNTKIRVKYFSILKMKTFESFMSSLIEVITILKEMKQTLNKSFYGYYKERDKSIMNLYLKNIVNLNRKSSYIARLMPNVFLYYSPVCITRQLDIVNNNELVVRDNETIFLLKDQVCIKTNIKQTVVVKYEKDKSKEEECTIITSLKEKNRCTYYEDMIYNKEDGGLYEERTMV